MKEFRQMRRFKASRPEECEKVLCETKRGVLAVIGDGGYPYCVPVDFVYEDGRIYIHGAAQGHKSDAVVAFGRAKWIEDRDEVLKKVRLLAQKYYPSQQEIDDEIARDGHRVQLLEIEIEHMTAKQVHEK